MKLSRNRIPVAYSILIIISLLSACSRPEATKSQNGVPASFVSPGHVAKEKYFLDKKESVVTWKGSMQFIAKNAHIGYVYISQGELTIEGDQLVGGTFEVDMNTIADKDHGGANDLVNHLKSPDFFDVERFPIATFVITSVTAADGKNIVVAGNMTIRGITHGITFPVKMEHNAGVVSASGKMIIDRTKWDIRYNSGKFYNNLADETISDDIELDVKIVARKK